MKKRNRLFSMLLPVFLVLFILPFKVSANTPPPPEYYTFFLSNLPEGTKYVDLLICLPESDELYVNLNEQNLPDSFLESAQILAYCEDDYRSYTFHFKDAISVIKLGDDGEVYFFTDSNYNSVYWHGEEIDSRGPVRLAMLDAEGNILKVSPLLDLNDIDKFSYRLNDFYYDAETELLEIDAIYDNMLDPPDWYIRTRLISTAVSVITEWVISFLFKLKGHRRMIFCTNIVSQLLMHTAVALLYLYSSWSYLWIMFILEILIYLGEYLFYWWRGKGISGREWFVFSLVSNTMSLLIWPILSIVEVLLSFFRLIFLI